LAPDHKPRILFIPSSHPPRRYAANSAKSHPAQKTRYWLKNAKHGHRDAQDEEAVEDPRHFALFLTLARSGVRIGEALGLQLADVDPDQAELTVRRNLTAPAKGLSLEDRLDTPKSGEERMVEIGEELASALRHHLVRRRQQNLQHGRSEEAGPWLFCTDAGTPLDESRVRKAFKVTLRRAGLPIRFTPHCLRHTYATLMLMKGAPLTWVSQQLGHSSPEVTLNWYWWALPSGNKVHASLLDRPQPERQAAAQAHEGRGWLVTTGDHSSLQVGAGARDRTEDLLITNQLLYR
jgi:integrase